MKLNMIKTWKPVCTSLFTALVAYGAAADQADSTAAPTAGATPEKTYKGTVVYADANNHMLRVKGWFMGDRSFNLGNNCVYLEPGKQNMALNTMRAGEKVTVTYQDSHGVFIANRVEEVPMTIEGMVTALNATNHMITVHRTAGKEEMQLAGDCQVVLRDGKLGGLDDIKVGNYVTVTYETPGNVNTAREIAQTSQEYTGTITAIDLNDRTIKAKTVFGAKTFHLADQCAIMVKGQPNGRMADLRPEEKLVFSYDDIDGVNVVNRIAPEESPVNHVATSGPAQGY